MDFQIALFLVQDGLTNGAIYALMALSLVLVSPSTLMQLKVSSTAERSARRKMTPMSVILTLEAFWSAFLGVKIGIFLNWVVTYANFV